MTTQEQTLAAFRAKRTPIRAQITRHCNLIPKLLVNDEATYNDLLDRKAKLTQLTSKFEEIQSTIEELDYSEVEQAYREEVENTLINHYSHKQARS